MPEQINYKRVSHLAEYSQDLFSDPSTEPLILVLHDILEGMPTELNSGTIVFPALKKYLIGQNLFYAFIDSSNDTDIPVDVYLWIVLSLSDERWKDCTTYPEYVVGFAANQLMTAFPSMKNRLTFWGGVYLLRVKGVSWNSFITGTDTKNRKYFNSLAELLPLSDAGPEDFVQWISPVIQQRENEGSLQFVSQFVYEWILLNRNVSADIVNRINEIALHPELNRFFPAIFRGIKVSAGVGTDCLVEQLKHHIHPSNAFHILYGIGFISTEEEHAANVFYDLLLDNTNGGVLKLPEFIRISSHLRLYRTGLFERIQNVLPSLEDTETLNAIIELLLADDAKKIEAGWRRDTYHLLVTKRTDAITGGLDWLLQAIAEDDLELAYSLIELRMKVMAQINFLQHAFIFMVQKDTRFFQEKLISWLQTEDRYLHTAIRHIGAMHELPKSLFEIPPDIFRKYEVRDQLYIIFKIVGYVYAMENLQALVLSFIKSAHKPNQALKDSLHYILNEYVIYNYRTTLELMKKEVVGGILTDFARRLFEQVLEEYETYFERLNQISVDKELRPNKEHVLLRGFYMSKQFSSLPKAVRENSISRLLKQTQINSNKWAIRRPGQIKHEVQPLAHLRMSSEFPSGEYLNPVFQEEIRKTYQIITKDEIDIY